MRRAFPVPFVLAFLLLAPARAAEPEPKERVAEIVKAAGGEEKLLKLFRMKERYNFGATPDPKGTERNSVLEPPNSWWLGTSERGKEPAKLFVWGWTLGALTDPKSTLASIPEVTESEKPAYGLRVTGSVEPAMDFYFDKESHRLVRIDWREDIIRFSEWKELDGLKYPAKSVMHKRSTGKPYLYHEVLELERLKELPAGLKR